MKPPPSPNYSTSPPPYTHTHTHTHVRTHVHTRAHTHTRTHTHMQVAECASTGFWLILLEPSLHRHTYYLQEWAVMWMSCECHVTVIQSTDEGYVLISLGHMPSSESLLTMSTFSFCLQSPISKQCPVRLQESSLQTLNELIAVLKVSGVVTSIS